MDRDAKGMSYSFRFCRLPKAKAAKLEALLTHYRPRVKQRFDKKGYCLVFPLTKQVNPKALLRLMRQHGVTAKHTDVFASLLAERDTGIIDVPEHVTTVLRVLGSKLVISFTQVNEI